MAPVTAVSDTVKRVVWTGVLAFVSVLATVAPGLLAAPNMDDGKAALTAAIAAGIAAMLSAIKNVTFKPGHPAR